MLVSHLIHDQKLSGIKPSQFLRAWGLDVAVVGGEDSQTVLSQEQALHQITGGTKLSDLSSKVHADYIRATRLILRELSINGGDQAVILNGRVSAFSSFEYLTGNASDEY